MTTFQLPSAIFPENAIKRAELIYQQRSAKRPRTWRRWLNTIVKWLMIILVLVLVLTLLLASITQRDPSPIMQMLGPLPTLLTLFVSFYDIVLIFSTISLSANSISREREGQTWEMLVLTGVNARQIVRGKWWATIQRQLPRYLMLSFIRAGATAASAISILSSFYYVSSIYYNNNRMMQLPHPLVIIFSIGLGVVFTLANLCFGAACGVMGSAASKRSSMAVTRGIIDQIVLSVVPAIAVFLLMSRLYLSSSLYSETLQSIYSVVGLGTASLVDNGFNLLTSPLYLRFLYSTNGTYSPVIPFDFEWIAAALITLSWYVLLTWFALWRAEKRAVSALATPVS